MVKKKGPISMFIERNYKHFNSLPKSQQEAIKQTMILGMLNNK
jgi:hypothetical protein